MKKLLTILLCCCMLTAGAEAVTAAPADSSRNASVSLLRDLGILTSEPENTDEYMSREEFSVYVSAMLRLETLPEESVRYFVDVESDGYAAGAINALAARGVISAAADYKFRPQDDITAAEAAKMLCAALGYKDEAEERGGFPGGYLLTANRLDILRSGAADGKVTVGSAMDMLAAALKAPLLSIKVFGKDGEAVEYDYGREHSVLADFWDIVMTEGTVNAVYGASTEEIVEDKTVVYIDGVRYRLGDGIDAKPFFGRYVRAYYQSSDDAGEQRIVSLEYKGGAQNITIAPENFIDFDGSMMRYYTPEGYERRISLAGAAFVYNGQPLRTEVLETLLGLNKGEIVLQDSSGDGSYDMAVIRDYANFVISSADTEKVYDKLGTQPIVWNDYRSVLIFNSAGNEIAASELLAGQTMSVARSRDGQCIEAIVSDAEVSGTFSGLRSEDETYFMTIGDEAYPVEKSYAKKIQDSYLSGGVHSQATLLGKLDCFGSIVYLISRSGDMQTGYILADSWKDDGIFRTAKLKLLDSDGKIQVLELADSVSINDTRCRNLQEAYAALPDADADVLAASGKQQLIRYSLNGDGKIKTIETASYGAWEGNGNGFLQLYEKTEQRRYMRGRFGTRATMTTATKIFFIPNTEGAHKDEECYVSGYTELNDSTVYLSNAYIYTREGICADAAVCYYDPSLLQKNNEAYRPVIMVETVGKKLNEEGEIVPYVVGWSFGGKVEYLAEADVVLDGIEEGDLVLFSFDRDNTIMNTAEGPDYTLICKRKEIYETGKPGWNRNSHHDYLYNDSSDASSGYYRANFQLSFGSVTSVSDSDIAWDYDEDGRFDETSRITGNIVIYDSERKDGQRIYAGKTQDVRSSEVTGADCAKIICRTRDFVYQEAFIYQ